MSKKYRSPHEAYPFLSEPSHDLRCDFELETNRVEEIPFKSRNYKFPTKAIAETKAI
ncbi:MAG: hypothetical protein FWF59_12205 [Turicibacter sp.]|nr:hypothetical protein [Turicibacter sp.]